MDRPTSLFYSPHPERLFQVPSLQGTFLLVTSIKAIRENAPDSNMRRPFYMANALSSPVDWVAGSSFQVRGFLVVGDLDGRRRDGWD